ncbi:MAG: UDP-N-acetylglucosamine diphosphorylase [Parachlamydiales bacterium]
MDLFELTDFAHTELFADIAHPWEALARLKSYLKQSSREIRGEVSPHAYLVGDGIEIGEGTVVEPGAYIKGPCIIGKECQIRHGAYIRGDLVTGDRCVIGHATEVKHAIFLNGAQAGHFAYVGDSILGNGVNLGAGVKLANFKLAGQTISVGEHKTGLRKLGAILGDGCSLGCNSVANPGTILGKGTCCHPCTSLGGIIGPKKLLGVRYVSD